jgi:hypothetical protein
MIAKATEECDWSGLDPRPPAMAPELDARGGPRAPRTAPLLWILGTSARGSPREVTGRGERAVEKVSGLQV